MTEREQGDPDVGKQVGKFGPGGRKLDSCCGHGAKSWRRGSWLGGKCEGVTSLVLRRSGKTGDTSPVV